MMGDTRQHFAEQLLSRWHSAYPGDGLLMMYAESPIEGMAVPESMGRALGSDPTLVATWDNEEGRTFRNAQKRCAYRPEDSLLPDPARAALEQGITDGQEGAADKVGAWRWPLVQKHADTILPLIEGKRVIDFGGMSAPVGYGAIIVDHGADAKALYDVQGQVDTVFTSHTLEHVRDLTICLLCIANKLRKGGHLVAHVPSWRHENLRAENWPHHHHTFALWNDGSPHHYMHLDKLTAGWADILVVEDNGHSILLIARKR